MVQVNFNSLTGAFKGNLPTYVITHGFQSSAKETWVRGMANDLLERDPSNPNDNVKANVISVDWSKAARTINYWKAVRDTVSVGNQIADYLIGVGANPNTTQLIGHSLGAHISGIAADRYDDLTGKPIHTIVGLDPAGLSFENGARPQNLRLDKTDARRVIAFHTSELFGYGYNEPLGDLDINVNPNRGWFQSQPGQQGKLSGDHSYAYQLYSELLRGSSFTQPRADGPVGSHLDLLDVNNLTGRIDVDTFTVA